LCDTMGTTSFVTKKTARKARPMNASVLNIILFILFMGVSIPQLGYNVKIYLAPNKCDDCVMLLIKDDVD